MKEIPEKIQHIIESAIFAAGEPLSVEKLLQLFSEEEGISSQEIREILKALTETYQNRGIELVEVSSGFRFQAKSEYATWLQRLWEKKPPRYSRALLETLALIVYRQPITRGEIEEVRGVAVNTNIIKTLLERNWIKIVGYKDVPGKPVLYGSTKAFLDYFNLKKLSDLPSLPDLVDLEALEKQLDMQMSLGVEEAQQSVKYVSKDNLIENQIDTDREKVVGAL